MKNTRKIKSYTIYHIYNRGNNKKDIFHESRNYDIFINYIKEASKKYQIEIIAYSIMPNHFHLLINTLNNDSISLFMQNIAYRYSKYYHRHFFTSGHLWHARYKSKEISTMSYFYTILKYMQDNPVKARLTNNYKKWKWFSMSKESYKHFI